MSDSPLMFSFQELAELMVKERGVHDGLWGIYVKFAIGAANAADATGTFYPTALVPVQELGLQKFAVANNLTVDAAIVNPATKSGRYVKQRKEREKTRKKSIAKKAKV